MRFRAAIICFALAFCSAPVQAQRAGAAPERGLPPAAKTDDNRDVRNGEELTKLIVLLPIGCLGLFVYLLPTFVAFFRGHQNAPAIAALNIFLGGLCLVWVIALVWSLTQVRRGRRRYYEDD